MSPLQFRLLQELFSMPVRTAHAYGEEVQFEPKPKEWLEVWQIDTTAISNEQLEVYEGDELVGYYTGPVVSFGGYPRIFRKPLKIKTPTAAHVTVSYRPAKEKK